VGLFVFFFSLKFLAIKFGLDLHTGSLSQFIFLVKSHAAGETFTRISKCLFQKARDLYQDVGLEMWKADSDIQVVNREMIEVRRHMEAVEDQIRMMKDDRGAILWPKPCLHPDLLEEVGHAIELDPCSFCDR
jgi:hypothetical protein